MKNNNSRATIREVYKLIEEIRHELIQKIDNLENNHICALEKRIENLEKRLYYAIGIGVGIIGVIQFFLK